MSDSLLRCEDLSVGYEKEPVYSHISFSIGHGDYLCILGSNGAGKSTLLKTILGLLRPMSGKISFHDGHHRGDIGYLPQQTPVQKDFPATVEEVVLSGFQGAMGLRPFYNKKEKEEAAALIKRLGGEGWAKRCYRDLSGGQQQRVLLARALCGARKLLLLDEPVSGLDPHATEEMYQAIDEIHQEGIAVIMVSHDVSKAMEHATHILFLDEELFFGTAEEFRHSELAERYGHTVGGCHHG